MKKFVIAFCVMLLFSCDKEPINYSVTILDDKIINTSFLKNIDAPEKALLSWYLYAYGNECEDGSTKNKCKILKELNINNECDSEHLTMMLKWFSTDMLAVYKLNKCPNLTSKSAIQNSIDKIVLTRKSNSISISYKIKGLNNSQEKSWNLERTDTFLIKENTLQKVQ